MGWATFLKWRETGTGDPASLYRQALEIDPHNVYANTMLGHWLMWQGEPPSAARPYFDAAISSGKERLFVRSFQLAAVRNRNNETGDAELVRVVNSMRQQNEPLDERSARAAYVVFERRYGPRPRLPDEGAIDVPVPDQLVTFTWLARMPGVSGRAEVNDVVVATLHNAMRREATLAPERDATATCEGTQTTTPGDRRTHKSRS